MDDLNNMSDNNFDQHLKSVLDNLEPAFDPATWDLLERKMTNAAFEEQPAPVDVVDKAVYHTLQRLEAPYQPAHWNTLANRMQVIATRIRRLRVAKIAEAAIFLLLLWNTESYWGAGIPAALPAPRFNPDVPVAQTLPGVRSAKNKPAQLAARNTGMDASTHQQLQLPDVPNLLSNSYLTASTAAEHIFDLNTLAAQARQNMYAAAELLPPHLLVSGFSIPERTLAFQQAATIRPVAKTPFFLSLYTVADLDRVRAGDEYLPGSGFGAVFAGGFRPGKWGVEAGIGYTAKQYKPKQSVQIYSGNPVDGYYGSTLADLSADLLTVPLKVTRRVAQKGRTSAHLVAGTTLNVAMNKNYDYGTAYFSPGSVPPNLLPDPNQAPNLQNPGRGLLENGSLSDNLYATVDAGIRIEHRLGKGSRLRAFVEPAYRHTLAGKGYGPKQEPVNTFGIQAGVMTYL